MNVGGATRRGTVASFDEHVGWGSIDVDPTVLDGDPGLAGGTVGFHCVAIADGSRTIEAGRPVRFRLVGGAHGRWEAAGIEPVDVAPAAGR